MHKVRINTAAQPYVRPRRRIVRRACERMAENLMSSWWIDKDRKGFSEAAEKHVAKPKPSGVAYALQSQPPREKRPTNGEVRCACGRLKARDETQCSGCREGRRRREPRPDACLKCGERPPAKHRRECMRCMKAGVRERKKERDGGSGEDTSR